MRNSHTIYRILIGICVCSVTALAQGTNDQPMKLSLNQAIQLALSNNKDIELARQNVLASNWDLQGSIGSYDPKSTFNSVYEHEKIPVTSFLSGGINGSVLQSQLIAGYRLNGFANRGGGTYEFNISTARRETNNVFAALSPQYPLDLNVTYTQPIGRGLRYPARFRDIEISKKSSLLTQAQFRQSATETIIEVQRAYWDLVFARRSLTIQNDALRDIRLRLEVDRRRYGNGTLASIDVVSAEARTAQVEQAAYGFVAEVTRAENVLKNLIAENHNARLWDTSILPTDDFQTNVPEISLKEALDDAMSNRHELEESDIIKETNAVNERYYRDQLRPQVDLTGSYGMTSLAGRFVDSAAVAQLLGQTTTLPDFLQGGYGQSLDNLARNRFNTFRIGVQISLPFHSREAEAKLGRAIVDRQRLDIQQEKLKQLIEVDVRNAFQAVNTADLKRRSASAVRESLELQFASEARKLDAGYSASYVVLERQINVAMSRIDESRAQLEQSKALAELQRSMGTALKTNNIVVRSGPVAR